MAILTNYEDYRTKARTGDLLQWHGDYTFSKIIRRGTGEYYNHSSFVIRLGEYSDHLYSIEALEEGLHLYRLSTLLNRYSGAVDVFPLVSDYQLYARNAAAWLLDRLDAGYDWSGVASYRKKLYERYGLDLASDAVSLDKADEAELFCSESVFLAFKNALPNVDDIALQATQGGRRAALWVDELTEPIPHLQSIDVAPVPGNDLLRLGLWAINNIDKVMYGINIAAKAA